MCKGGTMRRFLIPLVLIFSHYAGSFAMSAADKRPLTFDDLMKIQRVADPQISPNGKWTAYTVTTVDKDKNSKNTDVWILPVAGGEPRQLTRSPKSDDRPRWSPDSKEIAFVSTRD
jgi:dipeptidyl aminopeptidase/acylaminoacyl peptidase